MFINKNQIINNVKKLKKYLQMTISWCIISRVVTLIALKRKVATGLQ